MKTARSLSWVAALGVLGLACQTASAQYSSDFEALTGSPAGVTLNGQDLFYNPVAGSDSFLVFSYDGNFLGLPANPTGGEQFVGAAGPGGNVFARSQRDLTYGAGTGLWTTAFDIAVTYTGQLPSAQNLGSFSLSPFSTTPTNASYIALARWTDPNTAANWNADYLYFDAGNNFVIASVPDMGFQNLAINHWYRWSTTFDFDTNLITEVSITDITTGATATHNPVGWYLGGGAAGGLPPVTGFRFFAGAGAVAGNTMAFDNITIVPSPATLALLGLGGLAGITRRRRR